MYIICITTNCKCFCESYPSLTTLTLFVFPPHCKIGTGFSNNDLVTRTPTGHINPVSSSCKQVKIYYILQKFSEEFTKSINCNNKTLFLRELEMQALVMRVPLFTKQRWQKTLHLPAINGKEHVFTCQPRAHIPVLVPGFSASCLWRRHQKSPEFCYTGVQLSGNCQKEKQPRKFILL